MLAGNIVRIIKNYITKPAKISTVGYLCIAKKIKENKVDIEVFHPTLCIGEIGEAPKDFLEVVEEHQLTELERVGLNQLRACPNEVFTQ